MARSLNLSGKKLDLTLNNFNSTDIIFNDLVEVTSSADIINIDYTFNVTAYLKVEIKIGSRKVNFPVHEEKYLYLGPMKPVRYSYSDTEMVIGQWFYHHIRPLDYNHDGDGKIQWQLVCR